MESAEYFFLSPSQLVEFVLVSPELQTHAANIQCEKKPNVDKVNLDVRKKEGKLL